MVILHPVLVLLALFGSGSLAYEDDHCRNNTVDVTLILDTSNAVNREEILNMIDFSMNLVKNVAYSKDAVQFAVIKLSTTARDVFSFVQNDLKPWEKYQILNMIDGMQTDTSNSIGLTGLAHGLDQAFGLKGRRGVHDITIIMTAGADSRIKDLEIHANKLKGISEVFVIGFGSNVDNDQLNVMATNPLANIRVEEFLILKSLMDDVLTYLCSSCSCPEGQVCARITDSCITPVANCDSSPCDDNAFCTETVFDHTCVCHGNTIYNPILGCYSALPCIEKKGEICIDENNVCKDIPEMPLYQCECAPGSTGEPTACQELTCFHETPCDRNALCTDNPDLSYNCECIPPFMGLGTPGNCISCGDEHVRLVLVVDNAKRPDFRHFDLIQVFLMKLVELLTISGNAMAVSVIQTTPSKVLIKFDDFVNDKRGLINALSNIDQVEGESDMVGALDLAERILPAPEEGDPRNAVIILTSSAGNATSQALQETSKAEVFVIGLGSQTPALEALASDVDEFIRVEELTALIDIAGAVRDLLCPPCPGGCSDAEVCDRAFSECVPAVNECDQEECQEFGFCTDLPLAESPTCSCRYLFVKFQRPDQDECYSPMTCLKGKDDCHDNAICEDSWIPGEYSCRCKRDYVGDGRNCTVIACSESDTSCDQNADCGVVDDAASCTCKAYYQGNGVTCTAEHCSPVDTTCDENADCEIVNDEAKCTCKQGYTGNGTTCTSEHCSPVDTTCDENADCEIVNDEAKCTCKQGYTGNGTTCTLVMCSGPDPSCDENAECSIVNDSPVCTCKPNYRGDGQTCTVIPCTADDTTCDVNAECKDQGGTSVCTCSTNYRGNGTHCTPEPCGLADTKCDQNANCTVENDQSACTCKENYEGNGERCSIMPCSDFFNPCSSHATCIHENGAVSCTCTRGYTGDGYNCTVIPCDYADRTCDENALCKVEGGEVSCTCKEHYEGNGFSCTEDPCSALFSPCSENAACSPENGVAICTCLNGYEGNGIDCTEMPCSRRFSPCSTHASCTPENGKAMCTCEDGYDGDGVTCEEMPCSRRFSPCSTHASCTPENGIAMCTCEDGYDGDGVTCEENPCVYDTHNCDDNATCISTNEDPYHNCTCNNGYYGWGYSGLCHQESLLTGCQKKDVIFLIKTTLSMDLDMAIEFAAGVVSIFPPEYRVAIMSYTYKCVVVKPFNDAPHSITIDTLRAMSKTEQLVPGFHHRALQDVVDLLVGSEGDRQDVDNVVIVLTHGPIINETSFNQAVSNLQAKVSRVMFVGVEAANQYRARLSRMASDGESNVFNIEDWEDITFNMESVASSLVCPNVFAEYLEGTYRSQ